MTKMRYYNQSTSTWTALDAANADTLNHLTSDNLTGNRIYQNKPSNDQYYFIATLPPSGSTTYDKLLIEMNGGGFDSTTLIRDWIEMGNRSTSNNSTTSQFNYQYAQIGADPNSKRQNFRIVAYQKSDGSIQTYLRSVANMDASLIVVARGISVEGQTATSIPIGSAINSLLLSDPLTASTVWTTQSGSFTFGASGATSSANSSLITAGSGGFSTTNNATTGEHLEVIAQATVTTPSTLSTSNNGAIRLYVDTNDYYRAYIDNTGFHLSKSVSGAVTSLANATTTISVSTSYTITLSLTPSGSLVATLYAGTNTSGTVLQTLTVNDTSFTGSFSIGVGGDTGVVIANASVTTIPSGVVVFDSGNNATYPANVQMAVGGLTVGGKSVATLDATGNVPKSQLGNVVSGGVTNSYSAWVN